MSGFASEIAQRVRAVGPVQISRFAIIDSGVVEEDLARELRTAGFEVFLDDDKETWTVQTAMKARKS